MDCSSIVQMSLSYSFTADGEEAICLVKTQHSKFCNSVSGRACPDVLQKILKGSVQCMW